MMARTLRGLGALVVASALPLVPVCGCGASAQVAAGRGREQLDLSRLIVWHTQDSNLATIQTFYDKSGKRLDELHIGYLFSRRIEIRFSEGLAVGRLDDERQVCGYVDRAGRVLIPFQFCYAYPFRNGLALVAVRDANAHRRRREGLIDRRGEWIVPAGRYDELRSGREGRWPFGVLTRPADERPRRGFSDDDKRWDDGKRWGFLDANGMVVIGPKYWEVGSYREGLCFVDDGNR